MVSRMSCDLLVMWLVIIVRGVRRGRMMVVVKNVAVGRVPVVL